MSKKALALLKPTGVWTLQAGNQGNFDAQSKNAAGFKPEIPRPQTPTIFSLTAGSISGLFARLCVSVGIQDLTFHDLRRTAITRLAAKLTPFELAKMVGHRDLKVTLAVYYKQDAEEVARKL